MYLYGLLVPQIPDEFALFDCNLISYGASSPGTIFATYLMTHPDYFCLSFIGTSLHTHLSKFAILPSADSLVTDVVDVGR